MLRPGYRAIHWKVVVVCLELYVILRKLQRNELCDAQQVKTIPRGHEARNEIVLFHNSHIMSLGSMGPVFLSGHANVLDTPKSDPEFRCQLSELRRSHVRTNESGDFWVDHAVFVAPAKDSGQRRKGSCRRLC